MPSSILLFLHLGVEQIQLRRNYSGCRSLTPFDPVLPVQDIFTIKSQSDEHFRQSWGRTMFWNSPSQNTNRSFFINRSSSIKTPTFPFSLTPIPNRQFGAPLAHQLVQSHCHLFQLEMMLRKNIVWIFFGYKSTLVQLNWNESEWYIPPLCPVRPFSPDHRGQISGKKSFARNGERNRLKIMRKKHNNLMRDKQVLWNRSLLNEIEKEIDPRRAILSGALLEQSQNSCILLITRRWCDKS